MLSLSVVQSSMGPSYYEKEDYYLKDVPIEQNAFHGSLKDTLSPHGFTQEAFSSFLNSRDLNNNKLGAHHKTGKRRAGLDCTFSAPKSVSLAALVKGDQKLLEAHKNAVKKALDYIESHLIGTRSGPREQRVFEQTGNMLAANFMHVSSRELDPQLHTHAVIFNFTQDKNKRYKSLHNDFLFKNKKMAGLVYTSELAKACLNLGYAIDNKHNGNFEIAGYTQKALASFSQRRHQILLEGAKLLLTKDMMESLKELGEDFSCEVRNKKMHIMVSKTTIEGFRIKKRGDSWAVVDFSSARSFVHTQNEYRAQVAYKDTRNAVNTNKKAKSSIDFSTLKTHWQERCHELHITHPEPQQSLRSQGAHQGPLQITPDFSWHVKNLEEKQSVWTEQDLVASVLQQGMGSAVYEDVNKELSQYIGVSKLTKLRGTAHNNDLYTTKQTLFLEGAIFSMEQEGRASYEAVLSYEKARSLSEDTGFTPGQKAAFELLVTTNNQFTALVGVAGSGKTYTLKFVSDAYQKKGYAVIALGPDAATAQVLSRSLGIQGETVHRNIMKSEDSSTHNKKLYIVDEASKLDTQTLHNFMKKVCAENARVIFSGDYRQLGSVRAGGSFTELLNQEGISKVEITEHRRQVNPVLKDAVTYFSKQDLANIEKSFSLITDRIVASPTREETITRAVDCYMKSVASGADQILIADINTDRLRLTEQLRGRLKDTGILGTQDHTVLFASPKGLTTLESGYIGSYTIGDRVSLGSLAATHPRSQAAGRDPLYTVIGVDQKSGFLSLEDPDSKTLKVKPQTSFQVFKISEFTISTGDTLMWRKNHEGRTNGHRVVVTGIDETYVHLRDLKTGTRDKVYKKTPQYMDYGLVATTYGSQGMTCDHGIIVTNSPSKESWYVAISRSKHRISVFCEDKDRILRSIKKSQAQIAASHYQVQRDSLVHEKKGYGKKQTREQKLRL